MSKLIERKEDKFHNKLELVTQKTTLWSVSKLYDYGLSWQRNDVKASFRYWSTPEGDSILLDLDYGGPDWLFLRDGDIVIRINNTKNIVLKPSGENTDVSSNEGHSIICREVLYYEISSDDFKDLCDATSIEFQITGRTSFVNGKADNLQTIARSLYDELYGAKFNSIAEFEQLRRKKNTLWCMLLAIPASLAGCFIGAAFFVMNLDPGFYEGWSMVVSLMAVFAPFLLNAILPYPSKEKKITYWAGIVSIVIGGICGAISLS